MIPACKGRKWRQLAKNLRAGEPTVCRSRSRGGRAHHRRRLHAIHALGKSDGNRRLRVRRIRGARSGRARQHLRIDGLRADRTPPHQEGHAVPPGRGQLHHQRRAELVRAALRAPAWPERLRDGISRQGRQTGLRARTRTRRLGLRQPHRTDGAEHPGDQGHRRQPDLFRRPLGTARMARHPARSATSASTTSTSCRSKGRRPSTKAAA